MSLLIGLECLLCSSISLLCNSVLCNIPVIVSLHLKEENLSLLTLALRNQVLLKQGEDVLANPGEFLFYLGFIVLDFFYIGRVTFVVFFLLDG